MTDKPTDAELKAMWQLHAADIGGIFYYARAVLAKWGQPSQAEEPVTFLANATRFKMSFCESEDDGCGNTGTYVTCFEGFEKELDGRWVALVAAEDGCHLNLTPQPVAREPLTSEQIGQDPIFRAGVRFAEQHHGIKGGQHEST